MNLNDKVCVKLTEEGKKHLYRYFMKLGMHVDDHPRLFNDSGLLETEMWELMQMFGSGLYVGGPALFERNEVILKVPTAS